MRAMFSFLPLLVHHRKGDDGPRVGEVARLSLGGGAEQHGEVHSGAAGPGRLQRAGDQPRGRAARGQRVRGDGARQGPGRVPADGPHVALLHF